MMKNSMNKTTLDAMVSNNAPASLSIREMVTAILDKAGISREYHALVVRKMSSYLKEIGLTKWADDGFGGRWTNATEKGSAIGIRLEDRVNKNGEVRRILVFSDTVMEILIAKLPEFMNEIYGKYGTDYKACHKPEYAERSVNGERVRFACHFANHRFSDEEISALINGEKITISYNSAYYNNTNMATGHLQEISDGSGTRLSGIRYYRFVPTFDKNYVE